MTQQAQVFEVSAPAAPAGDAALLGSSTSSQSLVFRPGVTFPNNGPVQQNVFTHPNSSGVDGLTVLTGILNGLGLSPAIPLPSSTVELDFINVAFSTFTLPAALPLGANCKLKGISAVTILKSGGHAISGISELENVTLEATVSTAITSVTALRLILSGRTELNGTAGIYCYDASAGTLIVEAKDTTEIGANSFHADSSQSIILNMYDGSSLDAGGVVLSGTGTLQINLYSPAVMIDNSYYNTSGVTISFFYVPSPIVVYAEVSGGGQITFQSFDQVINYINFVNNSQFSTFSPENWQWIIQIDGSGGSTGIVHLTAGTYVMPQARSIKFVGLIGPGADYEYPTLILDPDVIFSPFPNEIVFENLTIQCENVTDPVIDTAFTSANNFVFNAYNCTFSATGGAPFISVASGTSMFGIFSEQTFFSTNIIQGTTGAGIFPNIDTGTVLSAGSIVLGGATLEATADATCTVDTSYFANTSFASKTSFTNPEAGATAIGPSTTGINATQATYRADATAGTVAYQLPAVADVPFDGWRFSIWIAVGTGVTGISITPDGTVSEEIMDPTTGIYQAGTWSSTGLFNTQGTLYTGEWNLEQNAWMISVKKPG